MFASFEKVLVFYLYIKQPYREKVPSNFSEPDRSKEFFGRGGGNLRRDFLIERTAVVIFAGGGRTFFDSMEFT